MTWAGLGGPLSATAEWLLTYALHSTLLLMSVWCVTRVVRTPEWRDLLWKLGLVGGIVTATLQILLARGFGLGPLLGNVPLLTLPEAGASFHPLLQPSSLALVLVSLWILGAARGTVGLLRTRSRLNRVLSHRTPVDDPRLMEVMAELSARAGLKNPVRLSTLTGLNDPITISRGETCLPTRTLRLNERQLRSILAHEVAHAKRRDTCLFQCGLFVERVLFFQPALRYARLQVRDAAEFLCDAWAAEQVDQVSVARSILEVASWSLDDQEPARTSKPADPELLPALMSGKSALGRRIRSLIEGPRIPELPMRRQWMAALLVWGAVVLLAPGLSGHEAEAPVRAEGAVEAEAP